MTGVPTTTGLDTGARTRAERERAGRAAEIAATLAFTPVSTFARVLDATTARDPEPRTRDDEPAARTEEPRGGRVTAARDGAEKAEARNERPAEDPRGRAEPKTGDSERKALGRSEGVETRGATEPGSRTEQAEASREGEAAEDGAEPLPEAAPETTAATGAGGPTGTVSASAVGAGQDVQGGTTAPLSGPGGVLRLDGGWRTVAGPSASAARTFVSSPASEGPAATVRGQVFGAISRHEGLTDGNGTLRLRLDPAHLGRVEITLQRQGGTLEISLKVESPEAERALRDGSQALGQAVAAKGGSWSQVQVSVSGESADEHGEDHEDEAPDRQDRDDARREPDERGEREGDGR